MKRRNRQQESRQVVVKHPLAIRWFHWFNFPILACMIWSGLLIYWANDVYKIQIGKRAFFHFFPDRVYKALNIPYHLAEGMNWHFAFMWLFFINGLLYFVFIFLSGQWRYLLPNRRSFRECWQVILHDLHIKRSEPGFIKYNAAQRIAYTAVIFMGFGSLFTGLAIYKPVQFSWATWLCGGYKAARLEHFLLTIGYVVFFLVHILQVIKTGWNNFQAMITGFELNRLPKTSSNAKTS